MPGPLPLGVCVIDGAIRLFGLVFPTVALKHRNQLLVHFTECIKQAKSNRQQAIQTNILTACLCALKVCVGGEIVGGLSASSVETREARGFMKLNSNGSLLGRH